MRHASAKAAGLSARVTAVLGSQWGDEGKGKLADVLAKKCVRARREYAPVRVACGIDGRCGEQH